MNGEKLTPITNKPSLWALSPLLVFLCLYLVTSIIVNDFYKVPITIAFMVSSVYAVCITKGLSLNERMLQYSIGAANKNIMLMIWIFILAGAFAQSAKDIGAIDATVNLTLLLLPDNLLLAGIFLAACFISLSIGTSVGTIVALVPVAAGIAEKTDMNLAFMTGIVVGGAFFGDNLSFISDTTIAATRTQGCAMRDKFRVNFMIALPAALMVFGYYIFRGNGRDDHPRHPVGGMDQNPPLPGCVGNRHSRYECGTRTDTGHRHNGSDRPVHGEHRPVRLARLHGHRDHRDG